MYSFLGFAISNREKLIIQYVLECSPSSLFYLHVQQMLRSQGFLVQIYAINVDYVELYLLNHKTVVNRRRLEHVLSNSVDLQLEGFKLA